LVYVHIPFCARRCSYCDFAIAVRRETPSALFADTVLREWRRWQSSPWWADSPEVETIYLGGGTPSRLAPAALEAILAGIRSERQLNPAAEITLEANPDDVNPEAAQGWRRLGISRVSLGAQSFSPAALTWMHRTHDAPQITGAMQTLRRAGFDNVSLDLIYGLPLELERDWDADLEQAMALESEHLSLYALTVEAATPLGKWTTRGAVKVLSDERVADEYLTAHDRLQRAGFEHYEVSNAARPGFRARHNAGYWQRRPFIGLGPSAHSSAGRERRWNLREWEEYRRAVQSGADPTAGSESLNESQVLLEQRYLGLRTEAGVPETLVPEPHRSRWIEAGWSQEEGGRIYLTPEGWLRLDALVAAL
jgi:oxygen-independent coproporphyrinogen-3 oxidase